MVAAGLALLVAVGPSVRFRPHEFSPRVDALRPLNLLGNAVDDFAALTGRELVVGRLMEGEPRAVLQKAFGQDVQLTAVFDSDGDGVDEIALASRGAAGATALVLERGDTLVELGTGGDLVANGSAECTLYPVALLRARGRAPVLACFVFNMRHLPRGVVAYDAASGAKLWYHATGAWPSGLLAADLDGDGRDEAVVSADAPENGVHANGTDDRHGWVIALDDSGRVRWRVSLGAGQSHVQLLARPGARGRLPDVVVSVYNHAGENPAPSRLVVLDGRSGECLVERSFPQRLGHPRLLDAARGTFVVGGADGVLRSFDRELRPLASRVVGAHVAAWGVVDLLGDGSACVVASTDREALVLDERLRTLGRFALSREVARDPVELRLARAGLRDWRVCTTSGRGLVLDLEVVPPLAEPVRLAGLACTATIAGLAAAAWPRRRRRPPQSQAREFLVDYRQVRHDVFDEARPFGRLWNWAHESVAGAPPPAGVFAQAMSDYLALGEGVLQRFAARADELGVAEPVVWLLRERLDALATALRDDVAGTDEAERARVIAAAMRAVSDACAGAYREVAAREPCRADEIATAVLAAKREGLAARGIALELRLEPAGAVPVLFAVTDLRSILGQLVENASTALDGCEGARLRVRVSADGADLRRVQVVVEDNGPGIAPADREEVFRPGVSTRKGGGFGLGHARELARGWRGELIAEEAAWGRGAALRLVLLRLLPFEEVP